MGFLTVEDTVFGVSYLFLVIYSCLQVEDFYLFLKSTNKNFVPYALVAGTTADLRATENVGNGFIGMPGLFCQQYCLPHSFEE